MPATQTEIAQIEENAQWKIINLLLAALSELADFSDVARMWAGVAGDTPAEFRVTRSDLGNYLITLIEQEIQFNDEAITHHYLRYLSSSGIEAENQARLVDLYSSYKKRLGLSKNEVERIMAGIWPFTKWVQAATTTRRDGGNRAPIPAAELRKLRAELDTIRAGRSEDSRQVAPPPEDDEEKDGDEEAS